MADLTLTLSPQLYPDDTELGAYPAANWPIPGEPEGAPVGDPTDTQQVADGEVTFTGLEEGVQYWVTVTDGEEYRYQLIQPPKPKRVNPASLDPGEDGDLLGTNASGSVDWTDPFPDTNGVVIAGDSITENCSVITTSPSLPTTAYRNDGYWTWAAILSRQRLKLLNNAGVGGSTSATLLARFEDDVLSYSPKYVVLLIGTNDVRTGVAAADAKANMAQMYDLCHAAGIHLIQLTIPPCGEAGDTTAEKNTREELNNWIKDRGRKVPGMSVVDVFPRMANPTTGAPITDIMDDAEVHPNAKGAAIMGEALAEVIVRLEPEASILPSSALDLTNFAVNGMMVGTAGSKSTMTGDVANSWTGSASGGAAAVGSKVASTDRLQREWQQVEITTAGQTSFNYTNTATPASWVPGDEVIAVCEFEAEQDWVSSVELTLRLNTQDASVVATGSANAFSRPVVAPDSAWPTPIEYQPRSGVLMTPPFVIPPNTARLQLNLLWNGEGIVKWGRVRLSKTSVVS